MIDICEGKRLLLSPSDKIYLFVSVFIHSDLTKSLSQLFTHPSSTNVCSVGKISFHLYKVKDECEMSHVS